MAPAVKWVVLSLPAVDVSGLFTGGGPERVAAERLSGSTRGQADSAAWLPHSGPMPVQAVTALGRPSWDHWWQAPGDRTIGGVQPSAAYAPAASSLSVARVS